MNTKQGYLIDIGPFGLPEVSIVEIEGLEDMQGAVGGLIERVSLEGWPELDGWVNDEGKLVNLPANRLGSLLLDLAPGDYCAGPLLVLGFDPETGDSISVDDDTFEQALARIVGRIAPITQRVEEWLKTGFVG